MSAPDPSVNQNAASKKCQKDTGGWLLENPAYLDWKDRPDSFLWLQGFAGCGKTILCSTVINDMKEYTESHAQAALAFYYFDFTNDVKTKTLSCLRSILLQLAERTADTTSLQALHRVYAMGTPPNQEFLEVLKSMLCTHSRAYIVVDALDECTDQEELFALLNSIRDWNLECLSILVTSGDEPDIRECVHPAPEQEINLRNAAIENDVRLFIVETLRKDKRLQDWSDIFPEIEGALTSGAHGMFRWVDCQLQTLRGCPSRAEVRKSLENLPETLDKTYERMLCNIRPNLRDYAIRLLQWLCIADGPVYLHHIMEAFATSIGEEPYFDPSARFVSSDKVLSLCPGLLAKHTRFGSRKERERDDCVQIAHYSVKEYLVSTRLPIAPNPLCKFRVQLPLANLAMAKTCLVYAIFAPNQPDLSSCFGRIPMDSFTRRGRKEWPRFFSNAKRDSQLMERAISFLTRKKGYTLDGDINAAIRFAIRYGLRDIETWLVDHHRQNINPSLVLLTKCEAAKICSLDFVEFWIKQGADVNARTRGQKSIPNGSTPLHIAASYGNVPLARLLLQNGASLKAEDKNGRTTFEVTFEKASFPNLDLIELLWFDRAQHRFDSKGRNLLHRISSFRYQKRDEKFGFGDHKVLMEETMAWLINHGVDPLSKDSEGDTPLHIAARSNNFIAIKSLSAATGVSSEYRGCLLAFIYNIENGECTLSTAELLLEVDPDPFLNLTDDSGLFLFVLSDLASHVRHEARAVAIGINTLLCKHEEDCACTKLDLYMSLLHIMLMDCRSGDREIMHWLAMELAKPRNSEPLGKGIWSAALLALVASLERGVFYGKGERKIHNLFQQIENWFRKREVFGVDIKELYRLLLWTALDGGPLAKLIIRNQPPYAALGLSDKTESLPRPYNKSWYKTSILSLMVHREIHPDTKNIDDDAALLNTLTHERPEILPLQTTRLLMKQLLRKRACDINHQTQEDLTILAGSVAYLPSWSNRGAEVLKSCLDAGCNADIQDNAGRTPLMIASYRGMVRFVEVLLNAGCNANLQDRGGGTPVTDIVVNYSDIPPKLWKQRFSPVGGHTALMYAVIARQLGIVKLLVRNGCDTKLKNNRGRTALDLARQFNESWIVTTLERHENPNQSDDEESEQSDYETWDWIQYRV